ERHATIIDKERGRFVLAQGSAPIPQDVMGRIEDVLRNIPLTSGNQYGEAMKTALEPFGPGIAAVQYYIDENGQECIAYARTDNGPMIFLKPEGGQYMTPDTTNRSSMALWKT